MYKLKKIFKNEKGQGMVEYGLILATVSIVAILGLSTLGGNIKGQFEGITESMDISEPGPGYSDEEIQDLLTDGFIPIATAEDLNSVRSTENRIYAAGTEWATENKVAGGLGKKYVQVKDIDLSEYSDEGWNPIGDRTSRFRGTYDGGNYVITGLEVKGEDKDFQGLFGHTYEATIRNVGLIDNKVTGASQVGGLVGWSSSGTIENSYAIGSVKGTSSSVGGLVGYSSDSTTISNSYATGSVTGASNVGGLVGFAFISTIKNSYATGQVTGSGWYVGGLVSEAQRSTISNSYATGSVTGAHFVGGLVGYGFSDMISNSYWDTETTGQSTSVGGIGKSTDEMKLEGTYEGWEFDTIWKIQDGVSYPTLIKNPERH